VATTPEMGLGFVDLSHHRRCESGGRLWHVVYPPTPSSGVTTYYYLTHPLDIIGDLEGRGWAFPAPIIGGVIALVFLLPVTIRWSGFLEWADIAAPGLALGQAIGRWGNFFNQELYGSPTTPALGYQNHGCRLPRCAF